MDHQPFLLYMKSCMFRGIKQKCILSQGRGKLGEWIGLFQFSNGPVVFLSCDHEHQAHCASLSWPLELALPVKWLCGAPFSSGLAPVPTNPVLPYVTVFLAISYLSDGGPASGEKLCGECAAIPGVHPGGAHGTSELGIQ